MQFRGRVAQQLTTIENQQIEKIRSESYETSEEVGFSFLISFGEKESEKYDKETHTKFMKYVKNTHASTVGGEPFTLLDEQTANEENIFQFWNMSMFTWFFRSGLLKTGTNGHTTNTAYNTLSNDYSSLT